MTGFRIIRWLANLIPWPQWHAFDYFFPWVSGQIANGRTPQQMRKVMCHQSVSYDYSGKPFCVGPDCAAWKWTNGKARGPMRMLTPRRGKCNHVNVR